MQSPRPLLGTPGCWQALTALAGAASPAYPLTPALAGPSPLWQEAVTHPEEKEGSKMQSQVSPHSRQWV